MLDARGIQHTYDRDFEYLEVVEQDLNLLSDNDLNSANDSLEADATCTVEEEKNKKWGEKTPQKKSIETLYKRSPIVIRHKRNSIGIPNKRNPIVILHKRNSIVMRHKENPFVAARKSWEPRERKRKKKKT